MIKSKRNILIGIGGLILLSLYFLYNPADFTGFFPECPIFKYTGYHCPGCGSQRAIHDLMHLNLSEALSHNPLMILTFLFGGLLYLFKRETFVNIIYHPKSPYIIFGIFILYWILRNLPFVPFTYLAP